MSERNYTPIEVAIALALYAYNVSPGERAEKLYNHFGGECAEPDDLLIVMRDRVHVAGTELAFPTACVYVRQALERYGAEAKARRMIEERVEQSQG